MYRCKKKMCLSSHPKVFFPMSPGKGVSMCHLNTEAHKTKIQLQVHTARLGKTGDGQEGMATGLKKLNKTSHHVLTDWLEARDGGDRGGGWENQEGRQAWFQNTSTGLDSNSLSRTGSWQSR